MNATTMNPAEAAQAAADLLADLGFHLDHWDDPARLARHLSGKLHGLHLLADDEATLDRLRDLHAAAHEDETEAARGALHAAQEAAADAHEAVA